MEDEEDIRQKIFPSPMPMPVLEVGTPGGVMDMGALRKQIVEDLVEEVSFMMIIMMMILDYKVLLSITILCRVRCHVKCGGLVDVHTAKLAIDEMYEEQRCGAEVDKKTVRRLFKLLKDERGWDISDGSNPDRVNTKMYILHKTDIENLEGAIAFYTENFRKWYKGGKKGVFRNDPMAVFPIDPSTAVSVQNVVKKTVCTQYMTNAGRMHYFHSLGYCSGID